MNLIYNTQEEIATKIKEFLLKCFPTIRKTQLKIIPFIVLGMILSESTVASDIAKELRDSLLTIFLILTSSMIKLLDMLYLHIRKTMMIKEFTLFLTICFRMTTILFL